MNTNLPLELNFTKEAENIEKCRQLLQPLIKSGELAVPNVYHSSPRVLVMSFEEGCYLTNTDRINELGVNKGEVARLISKTFCEQMYVFCPFTHSHFEDIGMALFIVVIVFPLSILKYVIRSPHSECVGPGPPP